MDAEVEAEAAAGPDVEGAEEVEETEEAEEAGGLAHLAVALLPEAEAGAEAEAEAAAGPDVEGAEEVDGVAEVEAAEEAGGLAHLAVALLPLRRHPLHPHLPREGTRTCSREGARTYSCEGRRLGGWHGWFANGRLEQSPCGSSAASSASSSAAKTNHINNGRLGRLLGAIADGRRSAQASGSRSGRLGRLLSGAVADGRRSAKPAAAADVSDGYSPEHRRRATIRPSQRQPQRTSRTATLRSHRRRATTRPSQRQPQRTSRTATLRSRRRRATTRPSLHRQPPKGQFSMRVGQTGGCEGGPIDEPAARECLRSSMPHTRR